MTTESTVHPGYLPCANTYEVGSKTGFHPDPPNPPGWGLLMMGLIILALVFMIWLFSGLDNDLQQGLERSVERVSFLA